MAALPSLVAWRRPSGPFLAITVVLVLTVGSFLAVPPTARPPGPSSSSGPAVSGQAHTPAGNATPASSYLGSVASTLVLFNNSLVPGNFLSGNALGDWGVTYDPDSGNLYVAASATDLVSVVNPTSNAVISTVPVGSTPTQLAYDASNGHLYVANEGSNTVSIIDTATNHLLGNVSVGSRPFGVLYDAAMQAVYVSNSASGNLTVINTTTDQVATWIVVGSEPMGMALDPTNQHLFVADAGSNFVTVVNAAMNRSVAAIGTGHTPYAAAFDPSNGFVYVANQNSNNVTVINGGTNAVVAWVGVGLNPYAIAYVPAAGNEIYVANSLTNASSAGLYGVGTVTVINGLTNLALATIPVGVWPDGLAYDPVNQAVYVANYWSANLTVIGGSSNQVTGNFPIGGESEVMGFNPSNGNLLVGVTFSQYVATVSDATNHVVAATPDHSWPYGVAADTRTGNTWVVNYLTNDVAELSGPTSTLVAKHAAGPGPESIAYDPDNGEVYIGDTSANSLAILNGSNGQLVGNIVLPLTPTAIAYDPSNGNVYVAEQVATGTGGNISVVAGSNNTILTTIAIAGDPTGVAYDPLTGGVVVTAAGTTRGFAAFVNGTSEQIDRTPTVGVQPTGVAYAAADRALYVSNGLSDNVSILDASSGQFLGTLAVGGQPMAVSYDNATRTIYVLNYGGDSVTVLSLVPPLPEYSVSFVETGLASGAAWSVTLNGTLNQSTGASVGFRVHNGSLPFRVGAPAGFTAVPLSGTVTVSGADKAVSVTFAAKTYPVTFTESGLAAGTAWAVILNGLQNTSTTSTIGFQTANGTDLLFAVGPQNGYTATPSTGELNVSGAPVDRTVSFVPFAPAVVWFAASPASVTVGDKVAFNITVLHGKAPLSYSYAGLPAGCISADTPTLNCTPSESGTFTVHLTVRDALSRTAQGNVTLVVHPQATSSSPTFLGLPQALGIGLIVAIVLVVAIAAVLLLRRPKPPASPAAAPEIAPPS